MFPRKEFLISQRLTLKIFKPLNKVDKCLRKESAIYKNVLTLRKSQFKKDKIYMIRKIFEIYILMFTLNIIFIEHIYIYIYI